MKIGVQKRRPGRESRERRRVWRERTRRRQYKWRGLRYFEVRIRSSLRPSATRISW